MNCLRRPTHALAVLLSILAWLSLPRLARAEAPCAEASCWNFTFLSSERSALLGLAPTLTFVELQDDSTLDTAVLARYRAEIYRTQELLSSRILVGGALGAGTAGTEGTLDLAFELGARYPLTRASGPVLRAAPSATFLGNDALQLMLVEPLRAVGGFQWLFRDVLIEIGIGTGLLSHGRFAAAGERTSLNGAFELDQYLSARVDWLRVDGRTSFVQPGPFHDNARVGLVRLEACAYVRTGVACLSLHYQQAGLLDPRGNASPARGLHAGITIGMTP